MTTLPLTLAMIAMSSTQPSNSTPSADFNNDGVVNTSDLIQITSNLGSACDGTCPTDLNSNGVTDSKDILVLMQQWGTVQGWVDPNTQSQNGTNSEPQAATHPKDLSWQGQGPVLYDAIYYDQYTELFSHGGPWRWQTAQDYNQGEYAKAWGTANKVVAQPMVYGSVDWDHDNQLTDEDKANFVIWLDATVPAEYNGPICLDLEGQWWGMLDTANQAVMDAVLNKYLEQLEYAKSLRPNAKIGFWGIPKKTHTDPNYNTASIQRLLDASTGLFPDVYEHNVGGNDASRLRVHVERSIEMVSGQTPVYAQTFPRYRDRTAGNLGFYHTVEEFMRDQVQSTLDAVWTDSNGVEHRVSGVSFWDAYSFVASFTDGWSEMSMDERKAVWNETDQLHVEYLSNMKPAVDAAYNAAQVRLAQAAAQQEAEAQAAAAKAAAELRAERKRQRSRLVRRLRSGRTKILRATSSFRKSSKQYRTARTSFKNKHRSFKSSRNSFLAALKEWRTNGRKHARGSQEFVTAWRKYAAVRTQFISARKSWRTDVKSWRVSVKSFRKQLSSYRTSRRAWRSTVKTWRTANAQWRQMAKAATTLASAR
ncbi:hypothetical protein H8D29_01685 [PVC group bacterium]|nr:hypothetical protein [PVC group bacterium]